MRGHGHPYSQWLCQHPLTPVNEALIVDCGSSASIEGHDTESHLDKYCSNVGLNMRLCRAQQPGERDQTMLAAQVPTPPS